MKLIQNLKQNPDFNANLFLQNHSAPEMVYDLSMECTSKNQLYPNFPRFEHCSITDVPRHSEEERLMHASETLAMEDSSTVLIQRKRNNLRGKGKINKAQRKVDNIKGQWSHAEDIILMDLVKQHGASGWSQIAEMLPGRVGKQCRERWQNHLRPDIKKGGWSEEEDKLLIAIHKEVGNKWSEIAKRLPWRSENTIKNHFNATKRRQPLPKNNRSRNAKRNSNLLQNYIRTTLSSSSSSSSSSNSKEVTSFETTGGATAGRSGLESKQEEHVKLAFQLDSNSDLEPLDYQPTVRFSSGHTSHEEYGVNSSTLGDEGNWVFDDDHYYDHQIPYDLSMAMMELEMKRENDFMAMAFQDFVLPF